MEVPKQYNFFIAIDERNISYWGLGKKVFRRPLFFLFYVLISVCVTTQSNNWDVAFNFTWFFLSLNDDDVDDHDGDDDGDNDLSLWYRWPRKCVKLYF